ncbi:hypothetical protein [Actinacidiphila sp. ITFR-21]|uniref:hypothetical protein n=1 Tax=Actinacidiphila sp. ITFR-21 TaxID=3075199 RepID=UPI0028894F03|nr:hypothetical protein [Streptomyces sp. ITFR-21]WNI20323.1 hypothetical protein RLT57_33180 [Streptomyces sp. ITFR-21]
MTNEEISNALDAAGAVAPLAPSRSRGGRAPSAASWEDAFAQHTVAVEGGHLHWTGATTGRGTPVVAYGGQVETGYRLAFRWHHGREPEGYVRPTCTYSRCLAGGHLADRVIRDGAAS